MKTLATKSQMLGCLTFLIAAVFGALTFADDTEEDLLQKAAQDSARGNVEQAIGVLTEVITKNPKQSLAFYLCGRENFRAGKIKESVSDLDKHVELEPKTESRQWERGIASNALPRFSQTYRFRDYLREVIVTVVGRTLPVLREDLEPTLAGRPISRLKRVED
jgi:hypothetical protein